MFRIKTPTRHLVMTVAAVCSALAFGTTSIYADEMPSGDMPPPMHGAGPMMGGGMHEMQPPFLHGVELSEQQKDDIFKAMYAQIPAMRENGKAIRKAQEALREYAMSGQYDSKIAQKLADEAGKAIAAAELGRAEIDAKILGLLTPEQQKQVQKSMKRHQGDEGEHRFRHF